MGPTPAAPAGRAEAAVPARERWNWTGLELFGHLLPRGRYFGEIPLHVPLVREWCERTVFIDRRVQRMLAAVCLPAYLTERDLAHARAAIFSMARDLEGERRRCRAAHYYGGVRAAVRGFGQCREPNPQRKRKAVAPQFEGCPFGVRCLHDAGVLLHGAEHMKMLKFFLKPGNKY